jgi:hypothetical protein
MFFFEQLVFSNLYYRQKIEVKKGLLITFVKKDANPCVSNYLAKCKLLKNIVEKKCQNNGHPL